MANVPKIRNAANSAWVDVFCRGGWKVKKADGTWITLTPANTKIRNADNTGWLDVVCPLARGTLISTYCSGTTKMGKYADGVGGTYDQTIQTNSTDCGYVPPPAAGTLLSTYCSGTTKMGRYANGSGGTYDQAIQTNSTECGYVPPPAAGTLLSTYCSGTTKMGRYANGSGGTYDQVISYNSTECGYVAPPPAGPVGWKKNWGNGALWYSGRAALQDLLAESGNATIQEGPNKGKVSPLHWKNRPDIGFDQTYHPRMGAVYYNSSGALSGFGTGAYAVYEDSAGKGYVYDSGMSSGSLKVVSANSKMSNQSPNNVTWYTIYYDPYGYGPGSLT